MYERFGACQARSQGGALEKRAEFRVFFPERGPEPPFSAWAGDPSIQTLKVNWRVPGQPWNESQAAALAPTRVPSDGGTVYYLKTDELQPGFYEYRYLVTFKNGTTRTVGDPCTKYNGAAPGEVSGFVIDDVSHQQVKVRPLAKRLPLKDLVIYELMLDDFTAEFRGGRAPVSAFLDRLDHLKALGVNAVEFMPWTAWPGKDFSWGYDVALMYAAEYRYVNDPQNPRVKLDGLKNMISACHDRGLHVILDGVYNHVRAGRKGEGFPYFWLYYNVADCPFIGSYGGGGFFEDLDYENFCTHQFILDSCKYWIDEFGVDGIRLDYTKGYFDGGNPTTAGVGRLISDLRQHLQKTNNQGVSLTIEHLDYYGAIDVCNKVKADSCWYDPGYWVSHNALYRLRDWLREGRPEAKSPVQPEIMRLLDSQRDFTDGRVPTFYIENHDHSQIASNGEGHANFFRTQPWAIALLTSPGAILLHNGQEFADDHWLPESGDGRVVPRPVRWDRANDDAGKQMAHAYRKLIDIRKRFPALRSGNLYPANWDENHRRFRDGYGVDCERALVIYHRWGNDDAGQLQRFIVVLNFADYDQPVDIPFSTNGRWRELLSDTDHDVQGFRLQSFQVKSNWGCVFFQ